MVPADLILQGFFYAVLFGFFITYLYLCKQNAKCYETKTTICSLIV